ncbi:flagellar motor stator protein MotA [Thiovibrio frasassiensis]|jgi:chemotaxis protein MotA|uniref:Flagellar motor stator protein MotA n=1 Tax=Thiovibrio frasassiensis TaxID=2984131 RepID=A0A9X4RLD7_9BACT|nr:flagellar motor stator protein MotA [Thiovibrio frasassiensis]MDG4475986.1 flagellar motor stator protein MotA [Thiovibrio frasassiensis]
MLTIIGIAIVLGSVITGYAMGKGNFHILFQPAEVIIIFGAAIGGLVISSPAKSLKVIVAHLGSIFADSHVNKAHYLELLLLMNAVFFKIKKEGLVAIESDIEDRDKSPLFQKYPAIMKDHEAADFICDTVRTMLSANYPAYELDNLMEIDLEANQHERMLPAHSITKIGDALPGLGIVAAVLGIVITMGYINESAEILGHHIGAALVGTFFGVLACYGFVGPMGSKLEHHAHEREAYLRVIKTSLLAAYSTSFMVQFAVEAGRRAIPGDDRPSFNETEEAIKKWKTKT